MKRYIYNSETRCWVFKFVHSCSWKSNRIGDNYHSVFFVTDITDVRENFNIICRSSNWSKDRYRSRHWSSGI